MGSNIAPSPRNLGQLKRALIWEVSVASQAGMVSGVFLDRAFESRNAQYYPTTLSIFDRNLRRTAAAQRGFKFADDYLPRGPLP